MNYVSHHHARIKSSIIKCMGTRAKNVLPCHQTDWRTEPPEASLPSKWVPSTDGEPYSQNCPHAPHSSTRTEEQEQATTPKFLHLSYVRAVSERIERKCRRLGKRPRTRVEEERSHVSGIMRWMRECLHWTNRKNTGEQDKWTQRSIEETRCKERHRSTCLDQAVQGGLAGSNGNSQAYGDQPLKKENNWSPAHPSATGNLQSWLWMSTEHCM